MQFITLNFCNARFCFFPASFICLQLFIPALYFITFDQVRIRKNDRIFKLSPFFRFLRHSSSFRNFAKWWMTNLPSLSATRLIVLVNRYLCRNIFLHNFFLFLLYPHPSVFLPLLHYALSVRLTHQFSFLNEPNE